MSDLAHAQGYLPADADGSGELALDPRVFTPARIGLSRAGVSLATRHVLELAEAHAQARDAVHAALPSPVLIAALRARGLPAIEVKSAAADRAEYLRRPDLGRRLSPESRERLRACPVNDGTRVAIVLADGLSSVATERHALPVLDEVVRALGAGSAPPAWQLVCVAVAEQARVALGDAVAEALDAELVVVLIGERPGLSSPDSLGAYITWRPHVGSMDAERNCVSNIRAEGLGYSEAAARIAWYCVEGRRAGVTGVALLANSSAAMLVGEAGPGWSSSVKGQEFE